MNPNNQIEFVDLNNYNNVNNQLVHNNSNSIDYEIEKLEPIFMKNNTITNSIEISTNIYIFFLLEIFLYLIETIGCAITLLEIKKNKKITFSVFFFLLFLFYIFHFFLKIFQYSFNHNSFKFYYHSQMVQKPSFAFFYIGISLYLENIINSKSIIYFMIPLILISFLPLVFAKKYIYFFNKINLFLIPFVLQYFLLIICFEYKNSLIIYPIFLIEIIISCTLSLIICVMFLSYIMSNVGLDRGLRDKMKNSSGFGIFFFLSWIGILKYNIMISFLDILRNYEELNGLKINKELKIQLVNYITLGIVTILINFFCFFLYNNYKNKYILANSATISKITFKEEIDLKIKRISDYFFVKENDFDNKDLDKINKENNVCYICYVEDNEILLKPCCHSGFCSKCFNIYIKINVNISKCPICKKKITHAYIIKFNEEKTSYLSQFKIIL